MKNVDLIPSWMHSTMTSHSTQDGLKHDAETYFSGNPYERENLVMGDRYADFVLEECKDCTRFLELGIGFGRTVERLSKQIPDVTVVDAEPRLIDEYRPRFPLVTFVQQFFESFQTDKKFCAVGVGFVIDLVKDPVALLRHYAGMLKPGGRIFLCVENALSLHRRIAREAGMLPDIKQMSSQNNAYGHQCYNTHDEWLAVFEEARLRVVASYGLYLKPFSTAQLQSLELTDEVYLALSRVARDLPAISNACFYILEK